MRDFLLLFNCYVVPGKGTSDLTHCIHSGRGGTKSLDKRKGGKWKILPILKRSLYQSHTIDKCWTRPQSNVATSSTPPPLEDHGSHRVAGCCTSFYFAVLSESGPITLEILKQLMSAITQKIEDLGPSHSANMANQVYGSAASSSIPSDWIRRFRGYQSHVR